MRTLTRGLGLAAAASLLATLPAGAALLKPMNLDELTRRADRIFSGTVLSAAKGSVAMGGGTLSTVTYRIAVDQALAGMTDQSAPQVVEVRMIGDPAEVRRHRLTRLAKATPRPDIEAGQRYLFFLTAPGRTGLSTTVGLGQGLFRVTGGGEDEAVVNQYGNVGLFGATSGTRTPARGPVRYAELAARVAALRGRK